MSKKLIKLRNRIIVSLIIFIVGRILPLGDYSIVSDIIAYLMVGYDVILRSIKNIGHGQIFDENFLMTLATFGAFYTKEYPEAVMVMWLYQVGELFQGYAVGKSRDSISSLMAIRPDYANIMEDGELIEVDPEDIKVGDIIYVKPGEKVPLDGVVIEGYGSLDTSALTGESIPKEIKTGDEILSGCISINGLLTVKVEKEYDDSTVARILDLVENASNKKAKTEKFITKFAKYYTPCVTIAAVLLAVIPPLFFGADFNDVSNRRIKDVKLQVVIKDDSDNYNCLNAEVSLTSEKIFLNSWATSMAMSEMGKYDFDFFDEKYSPFEGCSLDKDTQWNIRLSGLGCIENKSNVKVVLFVSYVARKGND